MANYNVGNIEIGVVTNSKTTLNDIDKVIDKLQDFKKIDKNLQNVFLRINQLSNGLKRISKLDMTGVSANINDVAKSTDSLAKKLDGINISQNANNTIASLNKIANAFRQFNNFKDFDLRSMYQSVNSVARILNPMIDKLQGFSAASDSIKQLTKFINAIKKLDSVKDLDFDKLSDSFKKINIILTPVLDKINNSKEGLIAFSNVLNNLKSGRITKISENLKQVNKHLDETKKQGKSLKQVFNLGKIYFLINYTKRLARALANTVTSAINFNETLNKFQVAMGENYDKSLKFIDSLTHAFNLSTESIMNYQSTFKNMLSALGSLSEDTSYQLSETLTRMAIDYASLFNVQVDRAMNQFQQVLSGQIRQIRTVAGYDVSESTIFSIYKELGGQKTMRQLDQVEKRLLRIIALQKQMEQSGAVGDFEKTISNSGTVSRGIVKKLVNVFIYGVRKAFSIIEEMQYQFSC